MCALAFAFPAAFVEGLGWDLSQQCAYVAYSPTAEPTYSQQPSARPTLPAASAAAASGGVGGGAVPDRRVLLEVGAESGRGENAAGERKGTNAGAAATTTGSTRSRLQVDESDPALALLIPDWCSWKGVTCADASYRVDGLTLRGIFADRWVGDLSDECMQSSYLHVFVDYSSLSISLIVCLPPRSDPSRTALSPISDVPSSPGAATIPSAVLALSALTHLRFVESALTGTVPKALLSSLSLLGALDLRGNRLSGPLPSLGDAAQLQVTAVRWWLRAD